VVVAGRAFRIEEAVPEVAEPAIEVTLECVVAGVVEGVHRELRRDLVAFVGIAGPNHGTTFCPPGSEGNVVSCDEGVEITVADQGPGVPEAFRERIFEKFQRLENRKTVPGANRGLGLTFCRLAVEAHGGTIWVDDAPGGGARFRALLPAAEEQPEKGTVPFSAAR